MATEAVKAVAPKLAAAFSIVLLGLAAVEPAVAQGDEDLEARANSAIQASDWSKAAELYSELTQAKPENAASWYRLGLATSRSGGDASAARAAFEKAMELGFPPAPALLGIARSFAAEADTESAFQNLERLAELGSSSFAVSQLSSDDSFAALVIGSAVPGTDRQAHSLCHRGVQKVRLLARRLERGQSSGTAPRHQHHHGVSGRLHADRELGILHRGPERNEHQLLR